MTREEEIQQILTYLTFAEDWILETEVEDEEGLPEEQFRYILLPLSHFNGADLSMLNEKFSTKSAGSMFFNPYHEDFQELRTMNIGPWQHCGIGLPDHGDCPKREKATALYHLFKFRKMDLAEVRGKFKLMTGDLVEWSHAWVYNDGTYSSNRAIFERRGLHWWCIGQPGPVNNPHPEGDDIDHAFYAAKSVAFTRYYDWRVEIGFQMPGRTMLPTIALPTDAMGARTAYRLRDVAPGKSRRDALRHWVQTHWRKNAYDPEEEIKIWAHLRGAEEFTHNGLKCRIVPSAYDLKKAAEYQQKQKEKPGERRKVS